MKQVRLLPIVIVAGAALLVLKGTGLLFNGGYVLLGTTPVQAAGAPASEAPAEVAATNNTATIPDGPTLEDTNPTLGDDAPTLSLAQGGGGGHGEAAAGAEATAGGDGEHGEEPAAEGEPGDEAVAAPVECDPEKAPLEGVVPPECVVDPGHTEDGDALPLISEGGSVVPLADLSSDNQAAVLERLSERREVLDGREAELDMRLALVEAAEKRLAEKTAALEALEAQIDAMVDAKEAQEQEQLVALVAMYETMKPKDAAAIFDELDLAVLLRVTRDMNPRKLAPIMAKMEAERARDLTMALAADESQPTVEVAGNDVSALPQIVGQ